MTKKKVPIVAIVGRANVGKSSFFNAVLGHREAIVANEPGTTRDSIMARASLSVHGKEQYFWIVDTAGLKDPVDDFEFTIQEQILQAADSADLIIVMIEANTIITEEDRRVAKMALKSKKQVILIANKVDRLKKNQDLSHLRMLGIKDIFITSATQSRGIDDVLEYFIKTLPKASNPIASDCLYVALLGRPNVGKSALFNSLGKKQQAIVSERAGTTRDVNRTIVRYKQREIELLDTAGIRRRGKIEKGVEKFSVIRSISAIEEADICLLLMDVNELNVQLDQNIAGLIKEAGKGLVLVVSKWDDALDKDAFTRDKLAPQISATYDFVPWAPLIFTSAKTGKNVAKIFDLVLEIAKNREHRISTSSLNRWLRKTTDRHPPAGLKNRNPKLNYIVQENDNPTPAFKIFGSHTKFLHWSYKRYLERSLREEYGFEGSALQLWFIEKHENTTLSKRPKKHG